MMDAGQALGAPAGGGGSSGATPAFPPARPPLRSLTRATCFSSTCRGLTAPAAVDVLDRLERAGAVINLNGTVLLRPGEVAEALQMVRAGAFARSLVFLRRCCCCLAGGSAVAATPGSCGCRALLCRSGRRPHSEVAAHRSPAAVPLASSKHFSFLLTSSLLPCATAPHPLVAGPAQQLGGHRKAASRRRGGAGGDAGAAGGGGPPRRRPPAALHVGRAGQPGRPLGRAVQVRGGASWRGV